MQRVPQLFFKTAVIFLIVGIALGLEMGMTEDHSTYPLHAHVNLLGWVTTALFGAYYALYPAKAERRIAMVHYGVYVFGLIVMLPALYLKYTGSPDMEQVLAVGSMIVALGVLIFAFVIFLHDGARVGALRVDSR